MTWNMVHFDVQLIGGIVLHRGRIAEMATGEGKTLVATLPLYLNALTGRGVHLVTVNDYLAARDARMDGRSSTSFLGLTVGCIQHDQPPDRPPRAVRTATSPTARTRSSASITCATTAWPRRSEQQVQRGHHLRHRRRSRFHPDRRSAHAAHHQRPGHGLDAPIRQVQAAGRSARAQAERCSATGSSARPKELFEQGQRRRTRRGRLHVQGQARPAAQQAAAAHDGGPGEAQGDRQGRTLAFTRTRARKNSSRSRKNSSSPSTRKRTKPISREKGRTFLNPDDPDAFVLPDLISEFTEIDLRPRR